MGWDKSTPCPECGEEGFDINDAEDFDPPRETDQYFCLNCGAERDPSTVWKTATREPEE